jgi:hypothetical protein
VGADPTAAVLALITPSRVPPSRSRTPATSNRPAVTPSPAPPTATAPHSRTTPRSRSGFRGWPDRSTHRRWHSPADRRREVTDIWIGFSVADDQSDSADVTTGASRPGRGVSVIATHGVARVSKANDAVRRRSSRTDLLAVEHREHQPAARGARHPRGDTPSELPAATATAAVGGAHPSHPVEPRGRVFA